MLTHASASSLLIPIRLLLSLDLDSYTDDLEESSVDDNGKLIPSHPLVVEPRKNKMYFPRASSTKSLRSLSATRQRMTDRGNRLQIKNCLSSRSGYQPILRNLKNTIASKYPVLEPPKTVNLVDGDTSSSEQQDGINFRSTPLINHCALDPLNKGMNKTARILDSRKFIAKSNNSIVLTQIDLSGNKSPKGELLQEHLGKYFATGREASSPFLIENDTDDNVDIDQGSKPGELSLCIAVKSLLK